MTLFCFLLIVGGILFITTAFIQTGQFRAQDHSQNVFWGCLILTIFLVFYTFITWLKIGRDPIYVPVARYEPPEDISPAFAYYLYNEIVDFKLLHCILLDLAMKKYIQIETKGKGPSAKTKLIFKKQAEYDLPFEERMLLERLYDYTGSCILDESKVSLIADIKNQIENRFIFKRDKYVAGNEKYIIPAVLIALALGIVPALFSNEIIIALLGNIGFALFFIICTGIVQDPRKKITAGIINTIIFITAACMDENFYYNGFSLTHLFYLMGLWITAFYISLIRNVTLLGKKTFEHLNGFKRYLKTAEINRIAASDLEEERIFREYLPYACAMDLYNPWVAKYSYILSKTTINQYLLCIGDRDIVSYRLKDLFQIINNRR
ncbi:MAG: DUF2207 domain-containing protein [Elusimicrobiaceae bacterium]|nr:DUF2207 domain-containing protein [Elusimicrobiaceae bacterium]